MKNKIIKVLLVITVLFFSLFVYADTKINLQIKTDTATIYDNEIIVVPCDSEGGISKTTPYCALDQLEKSDDLPIKSIWIYGGLYVDSINGVSNVNDDVNKINKNWMWLVNLNIKNTDPTDPYNLSAKQYILQDNDKILFYYNTNPLDIIVDKENPKVGENIKITGKELGLDYSSWSPVWNNAVGGKVIINGEEHELNENGEFLFQIKNEDSLSIKIRKENFIDSKEVEITLEKRIRRSSGSYITRYIATTPITEKTFSTENSLKFLATNQKDDGSFGESLYTDWATIGAVAGDNQTIKEKLLKYYKENNLDASLVTDNERRAMALMALGINPYTGTKINYIKKITDSFDGTQFGDSSLINDDIFALIVLKNAGYSVDDEIILKDVNYIISKQKLDGSWDSVDMTGAGIQSLRGFEDIVNVLEVIAKAENYLISKQGEDFGFENSFSTSWVLQSLFNNDQILKAEKYLVSKQEVDGGVESIDVDINTRIWATAYAIPAILHKPWSEILSNFTKPVINDNPIIIKKEEIKKEIVKKSVKILEEKKENLKIIEKKEENLTEKQNLFKEKVKSFTFRHIWGAMKSPFIWLWVRLVF